MNDHARLSLSHTDTWLGCAAWPRIVKDMGEETTPAIEFGNTAHEILEQMMLSTYQDNDAKAEEEDCAMVAYDYLQTKWLAMGVEETACLVEAKVKVTSTNRDDLWGSADGILYNEDELEIVDLKTGVGTYVDEQTSGQLMLYAIAAMETFDIKPPVIKLTIVQPRYWGSEPTIRTRTTTPDELYVWLAMVANPAAMATDDPNAEGTASVKCKQCAGRHVCEYRDQAVARALDGSTSLTTSTMEVQESMIRANQDAIVYDNARLSEVLMLVPVIRDYCDALEEHAREIIIKGEQVAGFKVVASGGRDKWLNSDAVTEALHGTRIAKDAYKHTLKTPKQVLNLKPSAGLKKKLTALITTSEGGRVLVMDSDKRESLSPVEAFAKVEAIDPVQPEPATEPVALPSFLL